MLLWLVLLICICFHRKPVPIDRMCTATEQTRLKGHTKARTSLKRECLAAGSKYVYAPDRKWSKMHDLIGCLISWWIGHGEAQLSVVVKVNQHGVTICQYPWERSPKNWDKGIIQHFLCWGPLTGHLPICATPMRPALHKLNTQSIFLTNENPFCTIIDWTVVMETNMLLWFLEYFL